MRVGERYVWRECRPLQLLISQGHLDVDGRSTQWFAEHLSSLLRRHVIDETGLTGLFAIEMTFSTDGLPGLAPRSLGLRVANQDPDVSALPEPPQMPSLETALREQLGLRLESAREPVPILVVEHVGSLVEN